MDFRIRQFVYRVRARLREQQIIESLIRLVAIGLFIAVILSFVSMVVPFYYAVPAAAGIVGLCFVLGIIIGVYQTPTPMEAALRADARGYKEKFSTAFYLMGKEDSFSALQKKDAVELMDTFPIRKEFPLKLSWKQILLLLGLSLVFVVSAMVDTPAREAAVVRKDVEEEAKEEIARLEKVEKELAENKEISETELAELEEQIENAKQELSEAESVKDLKKAEERIIKKMEMAGEKTQDKALKETVEEAAREAKETVKKRESDLAKEAREALERAENGSRKDKQDAYEKLKKLAASTGDERLEEAAEEYKDSGYSEGDYAAAQRALNTALEDNSKTDLAANQNQTGSQGSQNNGTNDKNQNNSQNNGNAPADNGNQNNSANDNQSGSQGNNQDGSQGQSGSQGNNQDGSQGQSGSPGNNQDGSQGQSGSQGNGQGSTGQGGSGNGRGDGNSSGDGWNYGGTKGRESAGKTNENITIPEGEAGDDENLTGKANGSGSSTKEKSDQSRTWSGNKVSYGEVSGKYKEKAYKKVNGSRYPGKLKDKIRDYFDGLN